jgi:small subunit ribosomal protein S17
MTKNELTTTKTKQFSGVVSSIKMDKTAVVLVSRVVRHPVYKKQFTVSKRFKIHDEKNECKVGDKVVFVECRPISKDKKWRLVKIEK